MRKHLLFAFLLTLALPSFAQYEYLAVAGVAAGFNALKGHPQKPDEYVSQVVYRGTTFPQKRTPANKLPGKGGPQITAVERLLASCYATLQAEDTGPVLVPGRDDELPTALAQLQQARPQWSTVAYEQELTFYRQQDSRRRIARDEVARQVAYQRQQRARAQRDSLERLALRRSFLIDSTRRAVLAEIQAQRDSVAQVQAAALASTEVIEAAEVAEESAPVAARSAVTPSRPTVARKPVVHKVVGQVKRVTGPTVYYCASGNRVKYHASPTCRGLSRCGATVLPISLREAEQAMEPCKWCY